jgi:uncharacterized protein YhaN
MTDAQNTEEQKLREKMRKIQDKLKELDAQKKAKEEKKRAKVKDALYRVLTELGLEDVPPDRIKKVLSDARADLLTSTAVAQSSDTPKS